MALNKTIALLLVLTVAAAPLASALIAPLNANTNVRCCGTSPGNCVDTDNQCNPVGANSCCNVAATLAKGTRVNALCWVPGQNINGDSRWLVITSPRKGYVADYYVSCGGLCKVPACN
jgi:hypothetical protein